jgi:23S rRNA (adenine2503-C2)-methyltransferase
VAESNVSASEQSIGFLDLDLAQCQKRFVELGGKPFHAKIAREKVFGEGLLDYELMTALPAGLRGRLTEQLPILRGTELERTESQDNTTKLLIGFAGGDAVETVHIPSVRKNKGATLCVSSQAGCAVGCPFCASGKLGLSRNLSSAEIIEQYLRGRQIGELARSVVMGVGEPLHNIDNLVQALEVVRTQMNIGARRITVSTVGFPDRLRRLAQTKPHFQLAISLHTPDDEQRDQLVPAMAGVPIEDVLAAGDDWFVQTGREITYEYVLLGGDNDSPGHAERLADRLRGRRAMVNLIPYNPIEELTGRRPHADDVEGFREVLEQRGIVATVRWSRGLKSDSACGQLRLRTPG